MLHKIDHKQWLILVVSSIIASIMIAALSKPAVAATAGIHWYDWTAEPFKLAKQHNKLIMVNVGHEGCIACRWMEENTFTNAEVIALLNQHFVSIQVDSVARPNIGERYSDWAWPATAFMNPDAKQVLAIAGSRRPDSFLPILQKMIEGHAKGELAIDKLAPYAAPEKAIATPLTHIRDQVRTQLDRSFDDKRGGWKGGKIIESSEPVEQYLMRAHLESDETSRERAMKTLYGFTRQVDKVWGGMFYASFGRWENTAKEKRLESQAAALKIFAEGYLLTQDPLFKESIENIDQFLVGWMQNKSGTFYANVLDKIPGLPKGMNTDKYYALDDSQRRNIGLPVIDHAVYTDVNARIISGYVRAYEATAEAHYLAVASQAASALLKERQTKAGWILQYKPSDEVSKDTRIHQVLADEAIAYLRPQGYFGLALLDLYRVSSNKRWLKAAQAVAKGLSVLEDKALGGFYGSESKGIDEFIQRRKPLEDNAVAARFNYLLGIYARNDTFKEKAKRAIKASAAPDIVRREGKITGNLAVTLELLINGYVEFSVIGKPSDQKAQALFAAGRDVYEPRKVLHFEKPGRYPKPKQAVMYICNETACSLPIADPAQVLEQAQRFLPGRYEKASGINVSLSP